MLADFFAGAGLLREALSGWTCGYALDIEPFKAAMYEARFPDTKVHVCDVMRTDEVVARIPAGIVLATGGFPCTDISSGGKKLGLSGPRSSAWYGFLAVLKALGARRPPMVLVENVLGLFTHNEGRDFREVALGLHGLGYRMACFVLHGVDFVPQSRGRIFLVGVADGVAVPETEVPLWWERRSRPAKLALLMNDLGLPWLRVVPPPPPQRQDRLADIVELDSGDWWPEERARRRLGEATEATRRTFQLLRDSGGLHVCTLGWKSKGWGIGRTDGVCQCLLPPRHGHGSSMQLLVVIEDGRVRMRPLSAIEYGRLMGSWRDRHILRPIAAKIGGPVPPVEAGRCQSTQLRTKGHFTS
jgi:DNA (cytosine-5)-methyltransferase 1